MEVYPAYCDALALANILAAQVEDRAKAAASASTSGSGELHKVFIRDKRFMTQLFLLKFLF